MNESARFELPPPLIDDTLQLPLCLSVYIGAFSLGNTLNGIAKSFGGTVDGIGKSLEGTVNGLGKFLDDTGKVVSEVVEATADVAVVVGVVYLYMLAGSHHYGGHHHHHGYSH